MPNCPFSSTFSRFLNTWWCAAYDYTLKSYVSLKATKSNCNNKDRCSRCAQRELSNKTNLLSWFVWHYTILVSMQILNLLRTIEKKERKPKETPSYDGTYTMHESRCWCSHEHVDVRIEISEFIYTSLSAVSITFTVCVLWSHENKMQCR